MVDLTKRPASRFYGGYMDEIAFFTRAVTTDEVGGWWMNVEALDRLNVVAPLSQVAFMMQGDHL